MRRELLRERDLRSTQVSPFVACSQLNKATIQFTLPGCSSCVKAGASLACRKGDERFGPTSVLYCPTSALGLGRVKMLLHYADRRGRTQTTAIRSIWGKFYGHSTRTHPDATS